MGNHIQVYKLTKQRKTLLKTNKLLVCVALITKSRLQRVETVLWSLTTFYGGLSAAAAIDVVSIGGRHGHLPEDVL